MAFGAWPYHKRGCLFEVAQVSPEPSSLSFDIEQRHLLMLRCPKESCSVVASLKCHHQNLIFVAAVFLKIPEHLQEITVVVRGAAGVAALRH